MARSQRGIAPSAPQDAATVGYVTTAVAAGQLVAVTAITAAYTLVLTDAGKAVEYTSATGAAITVPPNSSVAFPVGSVVELGQFGAGQATITAGAGVTLQSAGSLVKTRVQNSGVSIRQRSANVWHLVGDLA